MLNVSNAAISTGLKYNSKYLKILGTGYFMAYYFFNSRHADREVKKFSINPKFEIAQTMWNLLDYSGIKTLYRGSLTSIKYRKKMYLKRNEKQITLEYLSELLANRGNKKLDVVNSLLQSQYQVHTESSLIRSSGEGVFKSKVSKDEEKSKIQFII